LPVLPNSAMPIQRPLQRLHCPLPSQHTALTLFVAIRLLTTESPLPYGQVRPPNTVGLRLEWQGLTHFNVSVSLAHSMRGLDVSNLTLVGCEYAGDAVDAALYAASHSLHFRFTSSSYSSLQLPALALRDAQGDGSLASNVLELERFFVQVGPSLTVAGNVVPWGGRICLTPADLVCGPDKHRPASSQRHPASS
jgi:hypothetical protein